MHGFLDSDVLFSLLVYCNGNIHTSKLLINFIFAVIIILVIDIHTSKLLINFIFAVIIILVIVFL